MKQRSEYAGPQHQQTFAEYHINCTILNLCFINELK